MNERISKKESRRLSEILTKIKNLDPLDAYFLGFKNGQKTVEIVNKAINAEKERKEEWV